MDIAFQMSTCPLISVVVPVYNRPVQIRRAIDSVFAQTWPRLEIVVVDDGSTDETADVLREYVPRIRVVSQVNRGVSAARNEGVAHANGEWVAFLDSDDAWERDKLDKQFAHLVDNALEVSQTEEIWIRRGVRVNRMKKHAKPMGDIFLPSLERCLVTPSAVMMRRALFAHYGGFDETLPACEDYDLWLRMGLKERFGLLDMPLVVKYGGHDGQLSAQHSLDRYRIVALHKLLNHHDMTVKQRKAAKCELARRIRVFSNGAEKRGKGADACWARGMMVDLITQEV